LGYLLIQNGYCYLVVRQSLHSQLAQAVASHLAIRIVAMQIAARNFIVINLAHF
jgi:hypothetical protein